jgi:hypothetical protein
MKVAVALHKRKNCVSENRVSGKSVTEKPVSGSSLAETLLAETPFHQKTH